MTGELVEEGEIRPQVTLQSFSSQQRQPAGGWSELYRSPLTLQFLRTYPPPFAHYPLHFLYILYPQFYVHILQFLRMHPLAQENTEFDSLAEIGLPKQIGPQEFLTEVDSGSRMSDCSGLKDF